MPNQNLSIRISKKSNLFQNGSKSILDYSKVLSGSFVSRGVAFLNSIVIARLLGAELFGMFSIFYICMNLTWQFPQSFDIAFVRYAKTVKNEEEKKEYLRTNISLKILYFVLGLILAYPLGYAISHWFMNKSGLSILISGGIVCGIFITFLMTIATIYQEKEQFGLYSVIYLAYTMSVFIFLILIYLLHLTLSLRSVLIIYLVVSALVGLISIRFLIIKVKSLIPKNNEKLKKTFGLGKWIIGVTLLYSLFQRLDILVIARFSEFKEIGIYSAGAQITMIFSLFTGAMAGIFLPKTMNAVLSREKFKSYLKEAIGPICIVELMLLFVFIIAPFCVKILYGTAYIEAGKVLRILIFGWLFHVLYLPLQYIFYAIDEAKIRFWLESLKLSMAVLLIILLVPLMGAIGAAYAMSSVMILNFGFSGFVILNRLKKKYQFLNQKENCLC